MADAWLFWAGLFVGLTLVILCALAGFALLGIFLGTVIALAARSATAPEARAATNEIMRGACNQLPFCDCGEPQARH
jgi:hypothetical protein